MQVVLSTVAGAVAGFLAALIRSYFESRAKVDEQLHQSRTDLYQELWRQTAILPKWPRATDVTYERLASLCAWLRDWYFGVGDVRERVPGGLYLSAPAGKQYARVQELLAAHVGEGPIADQEYERIRTALSELRTQITEDLLSRRGAPFRPLG